MSAVDDDFLPISLVAHTEFCPRRTWLEVNGEHTDTSQMQHGYSAHRSVDAPENSRSERQIAVTLRSEKLRLVGRADSVVVLDGKTVEISEHKSTPVRRRAQVTPAHRLQLTLQRLCLEEAGWNVVGQSVYFTDHKRRVEVEIDESDMEHARARVAQTREITMSTSAPAPLVDAPQCSTCSHITVCLPDEHQLGPVARRVHATDPDGNVLHLTEQGSRASIRQGRVIVTHRGEEIGSVPLERVHGVVVHGNIDLSSALHRTLLWENQSVVWCSSTGRVYGWSQPATGPNGLTRVRQHVVSERGSLELASEMVSAKIHNQATLLRRNSDARDPVSILRDAASTVLNAADIPTLFGLEGIAAKTYFEAFPRMLSDSALDDLGWSWQGRIGRGAGDPLNILLNYCYGLLTSEAIRAILACGLDPHAGFLHSSNRNKPALALDLMEEFRAPLADSVVISLVNRREIRNSHFQQVAGSSRLSPEGRKAIIRAFERRIHTSFRHPLFNYEVTWRRAIEIQARIILGYLDQSITSYKGVRTR